MEKQISGVDWLIDKIEKNIHHTIRIPSEYIQQAKEMESQRQLYLTGITRLEIINHAKNNLEIGRVLTTRGFTSLEASIQDEGRTLKIFIS